MKYAFIEEQRTQHCIERMCSMLEVSRAGYYEWRGRPESMRSQADAELRAAIVEAHTKSRRTYGRPRIHAELAAQGVRVGSKRIGRIMKSAGIAGVRPRRLRKTTDSAHGLPVAANALARQFNVAQIGTKNRMWAGDISVLQQHGRGLAMQRV